MKFDGIKWLWFDLDDTLVDFHANSRLALAELYETETLSRYFNSREQWIETYENHNKSLWERYSRAEISQDFLRVDRFATPLAPHWEASRKELEAYSRRLDPLYLDLLARQKGMVDGATEVLSRLRAYYNIGILSNGFKDVQHRKLRNTGLEPLVDLTVLSDDIGINKPDRRIYEHAMKLSGDCDPTHHLMVGDNLATDIGGALGVGWQAVWLNRNGSEGATDGKHREISSLHQLEALLNASQKGCQ